MSKKNEKLRVAVVQHIDVEDKIIPNETILKRYRCQAPFVSFPETRSLPAHHLFAQQRPKRVLDGGPTTLKVLHACPVFVAALMHPKIDQIRLNELRARRKP